MSTFSQVMLEAVNDYKLLLRKNADPNANASKIKTLGIKRKQLKAMSEIQLYQLGPVILKELENNLEAEKCSNYYCGIEEFIEHLKSILKAYCLENNKVISVTQKASSAMLEAIQLMSLPENKLNANVAIKLNQCVYNVIKYGNKEQLQILAEAIKNHKKSTTSFFCKLWDSFASLVEPAQ